jgi:AraC-like DNA-binding protein
MRRTIGSARSSGIERSSTSPVEVLHYGRETAGLQRAEVQLCDTAFARHRHAEYALGITIAGVQSFRYRGARRICLPGQLHLLHPDEPHDGAPMDGECLRYCIVYVAPEVVRDASATGRLPFVSDPVHPTSGAAELLGTTLARLLQDIEGPLNELSAIAAATAISDGLFQLAAGAAPCRPRVIDLRAVRLTADYLTQHAGTSGQALEHVSGLDRYTLTRHFKAVYGTTPDRYRLLRQLIGARTAIRAGRPLAAAAVDAGFADQSHLTRHFTRTFGLTPGRWRSMSGAADSADWTAPDLAGGIEDEGPSSVSPPNLSLPGGWAGRSPSAR